MQAAYHGWSTETASSVTSQSIVPGSFTILPSVTETSGLLVSSETGSATESSILIESTATTDTTTAIEA